MGLSFAATYALAQNSPAILVNPDTVIFDVLNGSTSAQTRTVRVTSPGSGSSGAAFTVTTNSSSGGSWLSATPTSGTTPADLTITANPGALSAGTYNGTITVTPTAQGGTPVTINAVLRIPTISGVSAITTQPGAVNFTFTQGQFAPVTQVINFGDPSGGTLGAFTTSVTTTSGGNWLMVTPTNGTGGGPLQVMVNPSGLATGTYTGTITLTSGTATTNIPVNIRVNAATGNGNTLLAVPSAFNFVVNANSPAPASQTLNITPASATSTWTVTTTGAWLTATPTSGTGNGSTVLSVNASGLSAGSYEGSVTVTSGSSTQTSRVFLRVVGNGTSNGQNASRNMSAVQFNPSVVEFFAPAGGSVTPASQTIQVTSQTTGLSFTASAVTATIPNWLTVTSSGATMPGSITVTANATNLAAGTYSGLINVVVSGSQVERRSIPVRLVVGTSTNETARLTASPAGVVMTMTQGGAAPSTMQVTIGSRGAASIPFTTSVTTSTGGNWLQVSPSAGTAPTTLTISTANTTSLSPGVYRGTIMVNASGTPSALSAMINVLLAVQASGSTGGTVSGTTQGIFLTPGMGFNANADAPQAVAFALFNPNGTPATGANVQLMVSGSSDMIMLQDAGNGIYTGYYTPMQTGSTSLSVMTTTTSGTGSAAINTTNYFSVGGDVTGSATSAPIIFANGVVNSANYSPGAVPLAPGSIASLFGRNLAYSAATASTTPLPTTLGGLMIMVGGYNAPILSVTPGGTYDQINFQIPVELTGVSVADLVVMSNNTYSAPITLNLLPTAPGLFTRNNAGSGTAAALHANYQQVSTANPAKSGETILLYANGLGALSTAAVTGTPGSTGTVTGTVQVTIGGAPATVTYAGVAPGFVGLYQLNVTVPNTTAKGDLPVVVMVNGIMSGMGVTIPVQ